MSLKGERLLQNRTQVIELLKRRQKVLIEYEIQNNAHPSVEDPEESRRKMAELKRNKPCSVAALAVVQRHHNAKQQRPSHSKQQKRLK